MSGSKQKAVVSRSYRPSPDACEKAIETLLKGCVKEEGSPALTALEDAMKGSSNDRATSKSSR